MLNVECSMLNVEWKVHISTQSFVYIRVFKFAPISVSIFVFLNSGPLVFQYSCVGMLIICL